MTWATLSGAYRPLPPHRNLVRKNRNDPAFLAWQGFHVCVLLIMAAYTFSRTACGLIDARRRVSFDNTRLFWHYMVGQGLLANLLLHGLPRWS
jgi:hypothetical protein